MKNTIRRHTKLAYALVMGLAISHGQLALAGWTGAMNGDGYGKASVNVVSPEKSKTFTSTNMTGPSVSMTYNTNYVLGTSLPSGASLSTVAQVKGFPGYIWQANTVGSNGDSTDNSDVPGVTPADCAALGMTSTAVIAPDDKSGIITVNIKGTAGTGIRLRGFEYQGYQGPVPEDDPETEQKDEFKEFLKANGFLKFDIMFYGPMDLSVSNCNPLTIPFTVEISASNHLFFVADGAAKSLPLVIECPNDIVVDCQQPVTYPTVQVGGCGNITVSFNPPAPGGGSFPAGSFPVGTTPVTATATDKDGNTKSCTFNVVVTDTTPPAVSLTPYTIPCGSASTVLVPVPTTGITDNCGGTVTVTPNQPQVYNGTGSGVTWTFTDAAGNAINVVQPVVSGLFTFKGFYAPVGTVSNSCTPPSVVVVNRGSVAPLKFDMFCGTSRIITGTPPTLSIQPVSTTDCSLTGTATTVIAEYQNDWHYNWDTTTWAKATYKVTVNLPDGVTKPYVFIKIK